MRVTRHAYITQNNKAAFSLQYIKKKWAMLTFSHVDKHKSSLQINTDIWWGWSSISRVPKISSLQCLYDISKNKLEMKLLFCMQINVKVSTQSSLFQHFGCKSFLQADTIFIDGHDQAFSKYSNWQVCNTFAISQKREGVYFLHLDKHQSVYYLALFWRKWSDMSKVGIW